jgi:2,4-dienoyl-CoA reductase-like NADH-dependent reductase (Old Yellow Enzyme family)
MDGWDFDCARSNVEKFFHHRPVLTFKQAIEDIRERLTKKQEEEQFPLIYSSEMEESNVFKSGRLGSLELKNRIVKAATFEASADSKGLPLKQLAEFHGKVAASGVALTTLSYGAVSQGGRSFELNQLVVNAAALPGLKKLTAEIHKKGGKVNLQLTHAGFFAVGPETGGPSSYMLDLMHFKVAAKLTIADIEKIIQQFIEAGKIAEQAGFDCIEVHCGHGYLLSQFLSPYLNNRTDKYRREDFLLPLSVFRGLRKAVKIPMVCKFNLADCGGPGSAADLREKVRFALILQKEKLVDALVPSGGLVLSNGFFMLRGGADVMHMVKGPAASWVTRLGLLLFSTFVIQKFEFNEGKCCFVLFFF